MDARRLAGLDRAIEGRVIRPDAPDYDDARRTFNGMIDRRPAAIVRCTTDDDVGAAIGAARDHGLPLGVRGGGHSVAGSAIVEGGIVADLSPMRTVDIDPDGRVAHVGGGTQWQDLDAPALRHGLAVPGGVYGDTGVGGLTLGGGIGFLMGIGGLSCDNLVGARVVTADGRIVEASEDPDLLWALRGGGGNFGAVTRLDLALHPLGPMYGGAVTVPLGDGAILRRWSTRMRDAPDELLPMMITGFDEGEAVLQMQFAYVGDPTIGERYAIEILGDARGGPDEPPPVHLPRHPGDQRDRAVRGPPLLVVDLRDRPRRRARRPVGRGRADHPDARVGLPHRTDARGRTPARLGARGVRQSLGAVPRHRDRHLAWPLLRRRGRVVEPRDDGADDRVVERRAVRQLRDARRGRVVQPSGPQRIAPEPPTRPRSSRDCRA